VYGWVRLCVLHLRNWEGRAFGKKGHNARTLCVAIVMEMEEFGVNDVNG
jgi:hypothetical protein